MERESQISAFVSATTRTLLEKHVRATGLKKGYVIQEALLHYLRALDALPADAIVPLPSRIVVSRRSGEEIAKRLAAPRRPAKRLRALLKGDGD